VEKGRKRGGEKERRGEWTGGGESENEKFGVKLGNCEELKERVKNWETFYISLHSPFLTFLLLPFLTFPLHSLTFPVPYSNPLRSLTLIKTNKLLMIKLNHSSFPCLLLK